MDQIDYLQIDIAVSGNRTSGFRVHVLASEGGEADADFAYPFEKFEMENMVLRLRERPEGMRSSVDLQQRQREISKELGSRLYDSLFTDSVRDCLRTTTDAAEREHKGVRIRLRLAEAPELADVPWEYLYGPDGPLALSSYRPLVRFLSIPQTVRPLAVEPPLAVLVMISAPPGLPELNTDKEWQRLQEATADLHAQGTIHLDRLDEATLPDLQRKLRERSYHVFHYIGHGGYDEEHGTFLALEDGKGGSRAVTGEDLGIILRDEKSLRLAVLNACEGAKASETDPYSGVAQRLLETGLPAAIAMQYAISDAAATEFSHAFYEAAAQGFPIDAAISEARRILYGTGNYVEWATPVLFMRSDDGRIFDVGGGPAGAAVTTAPPPAVPAPPVDASAAALGAAAAAATAADAAAQAARAAADAAQAAAQAARAAADVARDQVAAASVEAPTPQQSIEPPGAAPPAAPPEAAPSWPGPTPDAFGRRWWWLIGGLVAVVALLVVAFVALSGDEGVTPTTSPPPSTSVPPTTTPPTTTPPTTVPVVTVEDVFRVLNSDSAFGAITAETAIGGFDLQGWVVSQSDRARLESELESLGASMDLSGVRVIASEIDIPDGVDVAIGSDGVVTLAGEVATQTAYEDLLTDMQSVGLVDTSLLTVASPDAAFLSFSVIDGAPTAELRIDGQNLTVTPGTTLPDGRVVLSVFPEGVVLSDDGELSTLPPRLPATGGGFTYVVVRGDTLSAIARRYDTTVGVLVLENRIEDPDLILVGQELEVGDQPYVVVAGDTLSAIARRYGTTVADLLAANPEIADPDVIDVGQQLVIPQ